MFGQRRRVRVLNGHFKSRQTVKPLALLWPRCGHLVRRLQLLFVAVVLGFFLVPTSASASKPSISPLKQGLAFYRGQTLTFNVPASAGAGFDIESRFVAAQMANYLHATINIVDYGTAGGIPGENAMAASSPNGLTIGLILSASAALNYSLKIPSLNFNPAREVFLGGWPNPPQSVITTNASPYTSWLSLESATSSNPVSVLELTNDSTTLLLNLYFKAFNIFHRNVTGYTTSSSLVTGFERGDGEVMQLSNATNVPLVIGKVGRELAQITSPRRDNIYYSELAAVPTFTQLFAQEKSKTAAEKKAMAYANDVWAVTQIILAAPAATKANRYDALRAAVQYAINTATVKQDFLNRGNPLGFVSPAQEKARYLTGLNTIGKAWQFSLTG